MGKKTKVVIDTNVIISAFGWGGLPEEVINLAGSGKILNHTSVELIDELRRVLTYSNLPFSAASRIEILETMFSISHIVQPSELLSFIKQDDSDDRVLECALSAEADFIITGDRHLLNIQQFRGISIITPENFLREET